MKFIFIFIFIFTLNCSTNKVSKIHGYRLIENKYEKIEINNNNKNDIRKLIGPASSISSFDDNKWFYIEREKTNQSIFKLGSKKIKKNNVLVLEFNNMGILKNKLILKMDDMNNIKIVKKVTQKEFKKNTFMYSFLSSFREKINAPSKR